MGEKRNLKKKNRWGIVGRDNDGRHSSIGHASQGGVARERSKKEKVGWNEENKNTGVKEERTNRLPTSPFLNRHVIKRLHLLHTAVEQHKRFKRTTTTTSWVENRQSQPSHLYFP